MEIINGRRGRCRRVTNFDEFKGEALVEDAIDLSATRQLDRANLTARSRYTAIEVATECCDHPEKC